MVTNGGSLLLGAAVTQLCHAGLLGLPCVERIHHPFPLASAIPVLCPQQLYVKDVTDLVRKLKFSRNRKFSRFQALGILGFSGNQRCNLSA